jgi:putative transposase
MQLVQQHIIKSSNVYFSELDKLSFLSKNLYNRALYLIKQHYFDALKDDSIKYKYLNYY